MAHVTCAANVSIADVGWQIIQMQKKRRSRVQAGFYECRKWSAPFTVKVHTH